MAKWCECAHEWDTGTVGNEGKGENDDTKVRTRTAARAIRAIVKDSGRWVESRGRNAPKRGKTSDEYRINDRA